VEQMLAILDNKNPVREEQDKWLWKEGETTSFSVKSAYKLLNDEVGGEDKPLIDNT